jgi:hypothetical protein
MRIAILAGLAFAAAGAPAQASPELDSRLDAMIGQPVAVAIAGLGQPADAAARGAELVYRWRGGPAALPFSPGAQLVVPAQVEGGTFADPRSPSCEIRVVVARNGLIRDWDYRGEAAVCRSWAARTG